MRKTAANADDGSAPGDITGFLPPFSLDRDDTFKPKNVRGTLNRHLFLAALNDAHLFHKPSLTSIGELARRGYVMNAKLQQYVDEWLETGRAKDGVEDPRNRDITKTREALLAVLGFHRKHQMTLSPDGDGLCVMFQSERRPVRFGIASAEDPLDKASRLFVSFMLCDWRLKLAKCRRTDCGRYFELKQANRTYKRGTVCRVCVRARSQESAIKSTLNARTAAAHELYQLAANRFARRMKRNACWHNDRNLKDDVAEYLNDKIERRESLKRIYHSGAREGITVKWLARSKNWKEIDRIVRKEIHAKG